MDEYIFNIIKKNTINNKMIDSIDVIEIIDILCYTTSHEGRSKINCRNSPFETA